MAEQQPRPDIGPAGRDDAVDRRLPGWIWGVSAGWLVLVGGWMPVLALVFAHRKNGPGAALVLSLAGIGAAATVVFGFVLGRWVPGSASWAKVGCAAPAGCLSWVFWFAIAYAVPIDGVDPAADDSGALGALVLGPFVLLLVLVLLGLGTGMGVALRTRTGNRARD
jgi:hypothetical protein